MKVREALNGAARRLAEVSATARLDAELLMAQALGVARSELLLRHMTGHTPAGFDALVARRARGEPVAYITGRQEFYGLDLEVTPAVLIPRADSETLVEAARTVFAGRAPPSRILDLGTGSGALLLAALSVWRVAQGVGIDREPEALAVAAANAEWTGISRQDGEGAQTIRARFLQRDWTRAGWREHLGRFDLILANPPYVEAGAELPPSVREFEPAGALFAGADGLDDYRILIPQLPHLLEPEGRAVLEIGATQGPAVSAIAEAAGFFTTLHNDLGGRPRALVLSPNGPI